MSMELLHVEHVELRSRSSVIGSSLQLYPSWVYVELTEPTTKAFLFYHGIRNCISGMAERALDWEWRSQGLDSRAAKPVVSCSLLSDQQALIITHLEPSRRKLPNGFLNSGFILFKATFHSVAGTNLLTYETTPVPPQATKWVCADWACAHTDSLFPGSSFMLPFLPGTSFSIPFS